MNTRMLLASAIVLGCAGTAMADEYYISTGPDRHCTVTTTRPAEREYVTQIGPLAFKSREEAQDRVKQTKVCSDSTVGSGTTVIKKEIDKD